MSLATFSVTWCVRSGDPSRRAIEAKLRPMLKPAWRYSPALPVLKPLFPANFNPGAVVLPVFRFDPYPGKARDQWMGDTRARYLKTMGATYDHVKCVWSCGCAGPSARVPCARHVGPLDGTRE